MSIIVQLYGGLGNQLFQYAFARGVSAKLQCHYRLDNGAFGRYYMLDKYALQHFNLEEKLARTGDFCGFVWLRNHNTLFTLLYERLRLKKIMNPWYYKQKYFPFDPAVFTRDHTYFAGFWQTEKYFKHIAPEIRRELTLKKPLGPKAAEIAEQMEKTEAVSIHVRRYAADAGPMFGYCRQEYYDAAMDHISKRIPNARFFLFSDDYDWVRRNFKTGNHKVTIVDNGLERHFEDLALMAKCRHQIIANSTFSWWGAWLNPNPNKIVIAPKIWFANFPKNDTRDLIPEEWIKM